MSIRRRLVNLEERAAATQEEPPGRSETFLKLRAVLDELAALKASCAGERRSGMPAELRDIPRQVLGSNYTQEELYELAAKRAADSGAFGYDEVPRIVTAMKAFGKQYRGEGGR